MCILTNVNMKTTDFGELNPVWDWGHWDKGVENMLVSTNKTQNPIT